MRFFGGGVSSVISASNQSNDSFADPVDMARSDGVHAPCEAGSPMTEVAAPSGPRYPTLNTYGTVTKS